MFGLAMGNTDMADSPENSEDGESSAKPFAMAG
jgi:hypothetical protein